jgi:hypothetical protein
MIRRNIPLLFFFYAINAQIALPTFQAVHKPHTTTSGTPENPLGSNISATHTNSAWHYTLGYRFTPQVNGTITQLGGYFIGTRTVRLWQRSNQSFLGSVSVTSNNDWSYTDLASSISVNSGTEYIVAVTMTGSGGAYNSTWNGPHTYGNILVSYTCWKKNHNSDSYPYWQNETYTNHMYGMADITFIPDS